MAESNSYPMLSANNWWNIRKKFKQTIPGTVTASYLSSVLNMQERSATNNIMPYLRQLGIIDAEGKTGERAKLPAGRASSPACVRTARHRCLWNTALESRAALPQWWYPASMRRNCPCRNCAGTSCAM